MNWVTSKGTADAKKALAFDTTDMCEHVEADQSLAYALHCEDDSFGPVGRTVLCEPCDRLHRAEEAAQAVTCNDCRKTKRRDETHPWRWYDFYAPQGDEPLIICHECWGLPRHIARRERDRQEAQEEMESYRR